MSNYIATDPIADLLARLRNAQAVSHEQLTVPHSQAKMHILKLLKAGGFVTDFSTSKDNPGMIKIELSESVRPMLELKRLSKPGRRLYVRAGKIPISHGGRGLIVVSTSQGMMSGNDARKRRLGGELICEVY